ncbi:hypothetical protein ANN_00439, partial [Periplaneta americana]
MCFCEANLITNLYYYFTVRKCPPLHLPQHAHVRCSLNNAWGSRCQLTCSPGHQLVGHDVTECGDKMKWTNPMPRCVAVKGCPLPMSPEHGRLSCETPGSGEGTEVVSSGDLLEEGTICRYDCDPGYFVPQSQLHLSVIRCRSHSWNSTTDPSCQSEAGSLPSLVLADAEYRHPLRHHRKRAPCWANPCQGGGTCLNGPHPSRPMLCICPPDREDKCDDVLAAVKGCPLPMSPEHGRLSCETPGSGEGTEVVSSGDLLEEGTICRYDCDPGYFVPQSQLHLSVIRCRSHSWNSTTDPSCQSEAGSLPSLVLADAEYRHPLRHHRKRAPCWANPCQGGGTCLNGPHPSRPMLCICPPDREGEFCERAKCQDEMCENGGRCMVLGDRAVCYCPPGFTGPKCQHMQ